MDTYSLDSVFKAYDVRGLSPQELDVDLAYNIGRAFGTFCIKKCKKFPTIAVAHDMRESSVPLMNGLTQGIIETGCDVLHIGLFSTDGMYYVSGSQNIPGVMITASHNSKEYNGMKFSLPGAVPVGKDTGLSEMKESILLGKYATGVRGKKTNKRFVDDYASHLLKLVDLRITRPRRIVVDAGNGMAGLTTPAVFSLIPNVEIIDMYFELDGTFPNHPADPLNAKNLIDLQQRVKDEKADLGIAFDGDADRAFFIDEKGKSVSPSVIVALIADVLLQKHPFATIIHNLITSLAVPEVIIAHQGKPLRTKVGHSYIKKDMADSGAIFGGEHSGHYYFKDFWNADSGMLAALWVLVALGEDNMSDVLAQYARYPMSGEINVQVDEPASIVAKLTDIATGRKTGIDVSIIQGVFENVSIDKLDGLTVSTETWWFNARPSNTEPYLRLNIEAHSQEKLSDVTQKVLEIIDYLAKSSQQSVSRQSLPEDVITILRCVCRGKLKKTTEAELTCDVCGKLYAVDGLTVYMLNS